MIFQNSYIYSFYVKSKLNIDIFLKICLEIYGFNYIIDNNNNNMLHLACDYGNINFLKNILKYNSCFDINIQNKEYKTSLHLALQNNYYNILKILLKYKANINTKMQFGETILHHTVSDNNIIQTSFLISNGANINSLDYENWSPLHWGCYNNSYNTVKILLENNANINTIDNLGSYPIHKCLDEYHMSIKIKKNNKRNNNKNKIKIIKKLMSYGTDINLTDNYGRNLIFFCSYLNIFDYLMNNNANIHISSIFGNTPLHYATINGNLEIVQKLLKNNIDFNKLNNNFETAKNICNNELIFNEFLKYEKIEIEKKKVIYTINKCIINEIFTKLKICSDIEILVLTYL